MIRLHALMNPRFHPVRLHLACLLAAVATPAAENNPPLLNIQSGVQLSWPTMTNNTYHPQWSPNPAGAWADLGGALNGDGTTKSLYDPVASGLRRYQVLEKERCP